ncbi:hypothetical protein GCM10020254_56040 [Streptomyces goshikiensis]
MGADGGEGGQLLRGDAALRADHQHDRPGGGQLGRRQRLRGRVPVLVQHHRQVGVREQRRDLLRGHGLGDLREADPAGLLARLAGRAPPLRQGLRAPVAAPLGDAPRGLPRHDRVHAGLGHRLDRHLAPVALGQGLHDGDAYGGLRFREDPGHRDDQPVLALRRLDDRLGPAAAAVREDHRLARVQPLHRDRVPALGAVQHELRPRGDLFDHEHGGPS